MKIRSGFVSNSSSSSFVISKYNLTDEKIDMILNYKKWIKKFIDLNKKGEDYFGKYSKKYDLKELFSHYNDSNYWYTENNDDFVFCYTNMDDFYFDEYLKYINVDINNVCYDNEDEPSKEQLSFIKHNIRENKINNIKNKINNL